MTVTRSYTAHIDQPLSGLLDGSQQLGMRKPSGNRHQHVTQSLGPSSSDQPRGVINAGKSPALVIHFRDRHQRIQNMNNSFRLARARKLRGQLDIWSKVLDLLLNLGEADNKLSSNKRTLLSPLDIIHMKIEKL